MNSEASRHTEEPFGSPKHGGIPRRELLRFGALGTGAAASALLLSACTQNEKATSGNTEASVSTSSATSAKSRVLQTGKPRSVVWAVAAIADWNLSYDVGMHDICGFLGWEYKKIGVPISQYSAQNVLKVIGEAIQTRPDILITPNWVQGQRDVMRQAQDQGIYVACNNANNFPETLKELGIPAVTADPRVLGEKAATALVEHLSDKNLQGGTIVIGNPYPENANQENVAIGARNVVDDWNRKNGTTFETVELADKSGDDPTGAIGNWSSKLRQLAEKAIGALAVADSSTQAAVKALKEVGYDEDRLPLAAVDVTEASLDELEAGSVLCVVDAGFYRQGWLPIMLAWQDLERGYPLADAIDASGSVITKGIVKQARAALAQQAELGKGYGVLLS